MVLQDIIAIACIAVLGSVGGYLGSARLFLHGVVRAIIGMSMGAFLWIMLSSKHFRNALEAGATYFDMPLSKFQILAGPVTVLAVGLIVYKLLGSLKRIFLSSPSILTPSRRIFGVIVGGIFGAILALVVLIQIYVPLCIGTAENRLNRYITRGPDSDLEMCARGLALTPFRRLMVQLERKTN